MFAHAFPMSHARRAFCSALLLAATPVAAADNPAAELEAPTIEVIGTTPVPGLGTPVSQVPANVQVQTGKAITDSQATNLPEFLNQALPSVSISEIQNNPYQPSLHYRGFQSSPLLGAPQGLSVYQDGVRINEPFGDVVNYDLIPQSAISTMTLIPGSNPLFGLNTLGGAIEIRTKSGRHYPGLEAQVLGGSFGRKNAELTWGGSGETVDYLISGNWFEEDGWRDFSPTEVRQLFAKIGRETADSDFDISITNGDTDLFGNGVLPQSMLAQRRDQIFTHPDQTRNKMTMVNVTGSQWLNENTLFSGLAYHRDNKTRTLNGDANDEFEGGLNDGETGANGGAGFNDETAVNNRTRTDQKSYGVGLQATLLQGTNSLAIGVTHDRSESEFMQTSTEGIFNSAEDRSVLEQNTESLENSLTGETQTSSLYLSDTLSLSEKATLTLSGRYNSTRVKTTDRINLTPPNLDGDFTYKKFNPAVGFTLQVSPALGAYAGWNQGNRAPSPIELGCADPANPCTLPNALASDPFLEQVVARTLEAGFRGKSGDSLRWNAGIYRTENRNDILFVGTTTSAGYFTNFGKTKREGAELGVAGEIGRFQWSVDYSFVKATFESSACLLSEGNSSRGQSTACTSDDLIEVSPGNQMPGIPEHHLRVSADFQLTEKWKLGGTVQSFSDVYALGNENNQHQAGTFSDIYGGGPRDFLGSGKAEGYTVLNLTTRYAVDSTWEIFGRINNVFDKEYESGAILAENPFDSAGNFQTNSDNWTKETFFAPGAPRAIWVGLKVKFGGKPGR